MTKREEQVDAIGPEPVQRLSAELAGALRRKSAHELELSGVVRAVAQHSYALRTELAAALDVLVRRGSFERPLYASIARTLAQIGDARASSPLGRAIIADEQGFGSLSAACLGPTLDLGDALARAAVSRHPHVAFGAELARVVRGDSSGDSVASIAPKIKESHRISICSELLVPLLWQRALPSAVAPALAVLRDQERHLGRWLVLGELAVRAGDMAPLLQAKDRASEGPASSRAAWELVAWALERAPGQPTVRPTVELISRLSDRPSADKDPTFLFRLAAARVESTRSMLEGWVKGRSLTRPVSIRSALFLARDHGQDEIKELLCELAQNPKKDSLRGLAAAALLDSGGELPVHAIDEIVRSRKLATVGWACLIRARTRGAESTEPLVNEPNFRRLELEWPE